MIDCVSMSEGCSLLFPHGIFLGDTLVLVRLDLLKGEAHFSEDPPYLVQIICRCPALTAPALVVVVLVCARRPAAAQPLGGFHQGTNRKEQGTKQGLNREITPAAPNFKSAASSR
jgi:hypothetical protein